MFPPGLRHFREISILMIFFIIMIVLASMANTESAVTAPESGALTSCPQRTDRGECPPPAPSKKIVIEQPITLPLTQPALISEKPSCDPLTDFTGKCSFTLPGKIVLDQLTRQLAEVP